MEFEHPLARPHREAAEDARRRIGHEVGLHSGTIGVQFVVLGQRRLGDGERRAVEVEALGIGIGVKNGIATVGCDDRQGLH